MTTIGRVYKLSADGCDKCYVGSTKSPYVSIRMAHHREGIRKRDKIILVFLIMVILILKF